MTPDVRVTERVEWRNVYDGPHGVFASGTTFQFRPLCDAYAEAAERDGLKRIAIERITITERVERFPVPEEGGR